MKVIEAIARHLVDLDLMSRSFGRGSTAFPEIAKEVFWPTKELEASRVLRSFGLLTGVGPLMIGSLWRHVKSGGEYQVIGACRIEATNTPAYLYRSTETGQVWCRPLDEFHDGRFERIPNVDSGGSK
ncbi:MAG: DUF1653 domain-containing protein [Thalassospira sp.]|uniref:DUF1653 domain-containing protein n=1 Tax=Thalassospira sp. TaxID=1912094 RepID=UPI003A889C3D